MEINRNDCVISQSCVAGEKCYQRISEKHGTIQNAMELTALPVSVVTGVHAIIIYIIEK